MAPPVTPAPLQPFTLLGILLEGTPPSADALKALTRDFPTEGLWHEWKGGKLAGESHCNHKIRRALASFANADGGILVLGYDQNGSKFDGFKTPGGRLPADWIRDVLSPVPGVPQPRTFVVVVDHVEVLVVAIARGETLVSVTESQGQKHYLRSGDGTLDAPAYLILDLLLGRRRQPALGLDVEAEIGGQRTEGQVGIPTHNARFNRVKLELTVRNDSLLHVDQVQVGLVIYRPGPSSQIAGSLREAIDDQQAPEDFAPFWNGCNLGTSRYSAELGALAPFESRSTSFEPTLPFLFDLKEWAPSLGINVQTVRSEVRAGLLHFDAAVYILARGVAPQWYQLGLRTQFVRESASLMKESRRIVHERPKVGVRFIQSQGKA